MTDKHHDIFTRRGFVVGFSSFVAALTGGFSFAGSTPSVDSPLLNRFAGTWRYRSFRNMPGPVQKCEDLLFWEADLVLRDQGKGRIEGTIGDATDRLMVRGSGTFGFPNYLRFEAIGIPDTETAGWKYNYMGFLVPDWPDGIDQRDAIVGTVVRTVAHSGGKASAGYVASFIAVRTA